MPSIIRKLLKLYSGMGLEKRISLGVSLATAVILIVSSFAVHYMVEQRFKSQSEGMKQQSTTFLAAVMSSVMEENRIDRDSLQLLLERLIGSDERGVHAIWVFDANGREIAHHGDETYQAFRKDNPDLDVGRGPMFFVRDFIESGEGDRQSEVLMLGSNASDGVSTYNIAVLIAVIDLLVIVAVASFSYCLVKRNIKKLTDTIKTLSSGQRPERHMIRRAMPEERAILEYYFERLNADEVQAKRSRYFQGVSHDIRQPLHGIILNSEIIREQARMDASMPIREAVPIIDSIDLAARELQSMVNTHLDAAMLESGSFTVQPSPVCVKETAQRAIERLKFQARKKGLDLDLVDKTCGRCTPAMVDSSLYERIINNLMDNALKYTTIGGITVIIDESPTCVIVRISDTGEGIDPKIQAHIFNDYWVKESDRSAKKSGYGLGLPLCKEFASYIGAEISVDSAPGFGSTFTLCAPKAREVSAA
jgi:signal transduction histidine kinase